MPGGGGQPYVGQIMMVGFNFPPVGWAFCDGQTMAISSNAALFQLIGTTFGGDGQTTFALPDLRGRVPVGMGQGPGLSAYSIGESVGFEEVTLTVSQLPAHTHTYNPPASDAEPTAGKPDNNYPALGGYYATTPNSASPMGAPSVGSSGADQPHDNVQPFLCINFIISLFGIFPTPN